MYRVDEDFERSLLSYGFVRMKDSEAGARYETDGCIVWLSGYMVLVSVNRQIRTWPIEQAKAEGIGILIRKVGIIVDRNGRVYRKGPDWGIPVKRICV